MQKNKDKQLYWCGWFKYIFPYLVISDADGLSFNYEGKSVEEDVYTARNEYKCQQELSNDLKSRLKLNFDGFYEEIYDD